MSAVLWICFGLGTLAAIAGVTQWVIMLSRMATSMRQVPMLEEGLSHPLKRMPCVHLIVPAHNEERVIEALLDSLRMQEYPGLRVTLALDRCTDKTAELARARIAGDDRFEILEIESCPADWAGKVNAVHQAAQRALSASESPELIAFADADVAMHPKCLMACVGLMSQRRLDLLSVLSTLTSDLWFEKVIQPSACMELVRQFPILRANGSPAQRPFANGQFMLFTREVYQRIGGHEGAKDELLEDLALSRKVAEARQSAGVFLAGDMLMCAMYPNYAAFVRGWRRIFIEAAKCKVSRLYRHALTALWMGTLMPLGCIAAVMGGIGLMRLGAGGGVAGWASVLAMCGTALGVIALLLQVVGSALIARLGRSSPWWVFTSIFGSLCTGWMLWTAARELSAGVPVRWAGREYVRKAR
ncbi:MAG: glycosyltransferase [Planctomycetes bacterium]|nr:glycosyltransferase [Planctomycetota bacterium]